MRSPEKKAALARHAIAVIAMQLAQQGRQTNCVSIAEISRQGRAWPLRSSRSRKSARRRWDTQLSSWARLLHKTAVFVRKASEIICYDNLLPSARHNQVRIWAPTSVGVSGDGGPRRGRALWDENRPRFYRNFDFNDMKDL
jgi:hypothetical protein